MIYVDKNQSQTMPIDCLSVSIMSFIIAHSAFLYSVFSVCFNPQDKENKFKVILPIIILTVGDSRGNGQMRKCLI